MDFVLETVPINSLKAHSRNYLVHPDDQLDHLAESIRQFGITRNVVTARDLTLLAGHGITEAAKRAGLTELNIMRLDLDPNDARALKLLVGDNELQRLADNDEVLLAAVLRRVADDPLAGLAGTGFDELMLANLEAVTRPRAEVEKEDEWAHWRGMPSYEILGPPLSVRIYFRTQEDREDLIQRLSLRATSATRSTWYPPKERDDLSSFKLMPEGAP